MTNLQYNIILNDATGEQKLLHFVHRDTLFEDYIFSTGYYLVMQPNGEYDAMFPTFRPFATDEEEKSDFNVAAAFKRKWKQLFDIIEEYRMIDKKKRQITSMITLICSV